jgi:hypothetical protein
MTLLPKAGADVNARARSGTTALISAVPANPTPEVITTPLHERVDGKMKDYGGQAASDEA